MKYSKFLATSALICAVFSTNASALEDKIIASVNNEIITDYDIARALASGMKSKEEAFSNLVQNRLIISLAKRFKLSANPIEINTQLDKIKENNKITSSEFDKLSKEDQRLAYEHARFEVLKNKLFDHIVANYGPKTISDEQIKKFFDENLASKGADFEKEKNKIKAFLFNQAATNSIHDFIEKEQAKAKVIMLDKAE